MNNPGPDAGMGDDAGSGSGGAKCGNAVIDPGEQCDDGNVVNGDGCEANCTLPACGNGIVDTGEQCDDGNTVDGDGCEANCTLPTCGNGIVDLGEQCDDGNTVDADGCEANCTLPACGNGIVDVGEACDDGNTVDADGCEANCTLPACGNGIVDMGEQCDDGNAVDGDGCETNCTLPACGNGIVDVGEACDDGNTVDADGCEANCTLPACGNGIKDAGEACDDGNAVDGDGCEANCTLPVCGNGIVDMGEACDDGNTVNGDGCETNCTLPTCGNGIKDVGEGCDDGNMVNGDGCENNCTLPVCGNGIKDVGEACDDGNVVNGDGCEANCTLPVCGNGIKDMGEACDDGNTVNGDGCENNCTLPTCGNGIVDVGEACDDGNTVNGDGCEANCTLPVCGNGILDTGEQCDDGNTTSGDGCESDCTLPNPYTYVKASNTETNDEFGSSVALSGDGATMAVGAAFESSNATGVGGNQANNAAVEAGAVYVFHRDAGVWHQEAYLKASNTDAGDHFGYSLALSTDGSTLAVGATGESSNATGIGGNQANNTATGAGAVYVFTRAGTTWSQQAYVKASNTGAFDAFGTAIALTGDGATLAVSATGESSAATGLNGNQADDSATNAGATYVFTRAGTTWSQQAYVKASNTGAFDTFGYSVALATDGSTLAVGAATEASAATGIGGNQADDSMINAGAVYVFTRAGTTWSQQAYVKASNTGGNDEFGSSVALAGNGSTLAVGAPQEGSAATGIGGNQADDSAGFAGAVYVFTRAGTAWSQQAYVKASNTDAGDLFGTSVALSSDGSTLAAGAWAESSAASGMGGNQADNTASAAGAVYKFSRTGTTWSQLVYVKATNPGAGDELGIALAISGDGSEMACAAPDEDSAATGIGGSQTSSGAPVSGAVYIVR